AGRWAVAGRHEVGVESGEFFGIRESAGPTVPRQIPGRGERTLRGGRTAFCRQHRGTCGGTRVPGLAERTVCERLGRIRQETVRRSRGFAEVSDALHAPRRLVERSAEESRGGPSDPELQGLRGRLPSERADA